MAFLYKGRHFFSSYQCPSMTINSNSAGSLLIKRYLTGSTNSPLDKDIELYSKKKSTPVSLKALMVAGQGDRVLSFDEIMNPAQKIERKATDKVLIQVACFLHRELLIRIAHHIVKLDESPLFARSGKHLSSTFKIPPS